VSARSRGLHKLARHCEHLAAKAEELGARPLYSAQEQWLHAADMAHRTAVDETWHGRAASLTWRMPAAARRYRRLLGASLNGAK
jgi:hypothetical protein